MVELNLHIRPAENNDYSGLLEIYKELDEYHQIEHPEIFERIQEENRSKEYISYLVESKTSLLLVALIEDEIIGFAEGYIKENSSFPVFKKREWFQLDNIAIKNKYQGEGFGRKLFQAIEHWATGQRLKRIELNVYSFNQGATRFYEQLGFHELCKSYFLTIDKNNAV